MRAKVQMLTIAAIALTSETENTVWPNVQNPNTIKMERVLFAMTHASAAPDQGKPSARMAAFRAKRRL